MSLKYILVVLTSPFIAIILTCFRLFDRFRNRLLGIDDVWAFVSMLFIITFVTVWNLWFLGSNSFPFRLQYCEGTDVFFLTPIPAEFNRLSSVTLFYLAQETYFAVVWSVPFYKAIE